MRATLRERLDPDELDGIISMHLIESDPALSKPLTGAPPVSDPGACDWFVLIDAVNVNAIGEAIAARFTGSGIFEGGVRISSGSYRLMWDLAQSGHSDCLKSMQKAPMRAYVAVPHASSRH